MLLTMDVVFVLVVVSQREINGPRVCTYSNNKLGGASKATSHYNLISTIVSLIFQEQRGTLQADEKMD